MKKIAIHSVPRSGSSWLGQIFNSSPDVIFRFQPLFSYAFKNYLSSSSSKDEIDRFFHEIAKSSDDFLLQVDKIEKGLYPKFIKLDQPTHIIYKEVRYHNILRNMLEVHPKIKVVGLVRNPFAVIDSFLRAPREFRRDLGWDEVQEWCLAKKKNCGRSEEFFGYEKWKEIFFFFEYLETTYPTKFRLILYDDLIKDTLQRVKHLFDFCEISWNDQTEKFINDSRRIERSDTYSVYRKKSSDTMWENSLSPKIVAAIKEDLEKSGLNRFIT